MPRSLDAIKSAKTSGLITDEDEKELTARPSGPRWDCRPGPPSKPVQKQTVKDLMSAAAKSPKMKTSVTDQVGDPKQTVTIEKDDTGPAAIDFQVPGRLRPLKQDNAMACWATVATILVSWKRDTNATVENVLTDAGQEFLDLFNAGQGSRARTSRRSCNASASRPSLR